MEDRTLEIAKPSAFGDVTWCPSLPHTKLSTAVTDERVPANAHWIYMVSSRFCGFQARPATEFEFARSLGKPPVTHLLNCMPTSPVYMRLCDLLICRCSLCLCIVPPMILTMPLVQSVATLHIWCSLAFKMVFHGNWSGLHNLSCDTLSSCRSVIIRQLVAVDEELCAPTLHQMLS